MDPSLIITGAMTLLKPLLEKAGEKAGENIGEKMLEKNTWQKIRGLFLVDDEATLATIEKKSIASSKEIEIIETKLSKEVSSNSQFATEIQSSFGLSDTNIFIAEQLLKSIQTNKTKLEELYRDRSDAGIETEGSYNIMIRRVSKRLQKDVQEFSSLIH